ncbi:metal ABC transporter permease [Methanoculleus sp. Afa-1]|uniref:Metal ABC transporter permease n=1 Tax=Methanoculleus formosensis TaxID=2590886 RepID=A0A9E4ZNX2_9EURY|nr:metal ABC transporter permease [Methanoculleus sp. Afa-1]MCT8337206.1 metal ABC transporter permease [Methanoculleus sp. Afa-1]
MLEFLIQNNIVCHAVEAMLFASIACAILSVIITQVQISSIGFTMAHAAFAGAAVGMFLSLNPTVCSIVAGIGVAFLIGPLSDKARLSPDTSLGLLFGICMAVAIFFIAYMQTLGRGFSTMGLLFGDVISLYREEIYLLVVICIVAVAFVLVLYKEITAIIFNKRIAESVGIRVKPVYYAMLFMIALTVSLCLPIIGGLLLYVWLVIPAAIALQFCNRLSSMFVVAPAVAAVVSVSGALIGLEYSLPVAPLTAIIFSVVFIVAVILSPRRRVTFRKT